MIDELTIALSDKSGTFHVLLDRLARADVNVLAALALAGTVADFGVVVLVCSPVERAVAALHDANIRYQRQQAFAVALKDAPGQLAHVTGLLAREGLNVRHMYHTEYVSPNDLPLTILALDDNRRGIEVLKRHEIEVLLDLPQRSVASQRRRQV